LEVDTQSTSAAATLAMVPLREIPALSAPKCAVAADLHTGAYDLARDLWR